MRHITMEKIITIVETKGSAMVVSKHKHEQLENELINDDQIKVTYRFGQQTRRLKQLTELGYTLKEVLENNATEKHHPIQEVWERV